MDDILKQYIKEIVDETLEKQHIQEYKNRIEELECEMNEHMETLELISHETNKLKETHNNLETTVQKHTEMLQKLETSVDYKNIHDILLVDEYIELINLEIKKISVLNNKNMIQILCGKIAQIEDDMEDKIKIIIDNL
jgi:predicted nuclease with TOPRIM domain